MNNVSCVKTLCFASSVAQQPEASQPATEQRRRLFGYSLRRRNSSRGGGRGLFGRCFLVRDGGAVVQVGADEALAASDVVDAPDRRVASVRQRETWLLLGDGADPFVTQVSVQNVLPFPSLSSGSGGRVRHTRK